MPTPRVLVLRAPGTNCDRETAFAFEQAGGRAEIFHVNRLLENPQLPTAYQILCIPGGFSYGDDVAAGRILGNQIRHHLKETLAEFKAAGKLVLGICNGFQVLIKSGVLLADDAQGQPATLTLNDSGRYEDRWVQLAVTGQAGVFLQGIESMYLPVAHAEGKFVARDADSLAALERAGQLALRYGTAAEPATAFPANPNGSQASVAGVCDESGRVFGLMPHPERHIDPTHHPRWTREPRRSVGDGLRLFQNAVGYFA
jgi:phosphoribosylformylglycinamidine synthase subunit PurQ / glutaminase